jgi:hypothetical protein
MQIASSDLHKSAINSLKYNKSFDYYNWHMKVCAVPDKNYNFLRHLQLDSGSKIITALRHVPFPLSP